MTADMGLPRNPISTWDDATDWAKGRTSGIGKYQEVQVEIAHRILAAAAELKRLREIVEHVCDLMDKSAIKGHWGRRTTVATDEFIAELRRRAGRE